MTKLGDALQKKFYKFAAVAIIFLALWSLNGALALAGVPNFTSIYNYLTSTTRNYLVEGIPEERADTSAQEINNNPTIEISTSGYSPKVITVEAGAKVSIKLVNNDGYSCAQSFTIPSLNLRASIPPGVTKVLEFTAPSEPGVIPFMCSMGMYRGKINVIEVADN
jgi:heme/copper-type cytochrome/quinol oxidase subunit 2